MGFANAHSRGLRPSLVEALLTPHSSFACSISGLHLPATRASSAHGNLSYHIYLSCSHEFSSCSHFPAHIIFPTQISNTNFYRDIPWPNLLYCLEQKYNKYNNFVKFNVGLHVHVFKIWEEFHKNMRSRFEPTTYRFPFHSHNIYYFTPEHLARSCLACTVLNITLIMWLLRFWDILVRLPVHFCLKFSSIYLFKIFTD